MKPGMTRDQRRAAHAWKLVQDTRGQGEKAAADFATHVRKMPARIATAGLGPALAFIEAKDQKILSTALGDWILREGKIAQGPTLMKAIMEGNASDLRRWTEEALAWLAWVKRFCDAEKIRGSDT
jgi:CRISPR-associated protein Cmr5